MLDFRAVPVFRVHLRGESSIPSPCVVKIYGRSIILERGETGDKCQAMDELHRIIVDVVFVFHIPSLHIIEIHDLAIVLGRGEGGGGCATGKTHSFGVSTECSFCVRPQHENDIPSLCMAEIHELVILRKGEVRGRC